MRSNKLTTTMVSTVSVNRQKPNNSQSQGEEHQPSQGLFHHHHSSLLSVMLFLLFLASCIAGVHAQRRGESRTYPLLAAIPETTFRCFGRNKGYYADVETGCQVYHMCDTLEKQFSFLCPNYTLFNQKFMICDHWYMVNCTMSDSFFSLNDHIGEVPAKGANAIDGGNNQGTRKSTILAQKPNGIQSVKTITPVSLNKFQSTTKTTPKSTTKTTSRPPIRKTTRRFESTSQPPQSSFFSLPKRPLTTKSPTKTTSRPPTNKTTRRSESTSQRPLPKRPLTTKSPTKTTSRPPISKTTRRFESTSQRPSKFVFSRSPFSVPSRNIVLVTTSKPARVSVLNQKTLKTTPRSNPVRTSVFTTRKFASTTPRPLNPFSNSVFTRTSSSIKVTTSQPARASVFNSKAVTSATTPKPSRAFILNRNTLTTTTRPNPTRTSLLNRNTQIPTTKKPFTSRFPGNVARSPGSSFSFSQMKIHNLTFSRGVRPSNPSFSFSSTSKPLKSNLKAHPLVTTPHSKESDEEDDQTSQHSTHQILAAPLRALSIPSQYFGIPIPSKLLVPPPFSSISNNRTAPITNIIEPPTARRKGFSPIKLSRKAIMNPQVVRAEPGQESSFTPFTMKPTKFRTFGISEEVIPGVLHVSFQSARGNRDFFIPSSGLTLPDETLKTPSNSLSSNLDDHDHDQDDNVEPTEHGAHDQSDHHMTMLFPGSSGTPVISALVLNPKCPHCHPAFLRPGRCTPCVRIR